MNTISTNPHTLVSLAIKKGILVRASKCEQCKQKCKTEAHHSDYDKPLEVNWLCHECHSGITNKVGYAEFSLRERCRFIDRLPIKNPCLSMKRGFWRRVEMKNYQKRWPQMNPAKNPTHGCLATSAHTTSLIVRSFLIARIISTTIQTTTVITINHLAKLMALSLLAERDFRT